MGSVRLGGVAVGEGHREGFSEEVMFEETLKEVKGEVKQVSGGRALWAEGTAHARVLRQDRARSMSSDHDGEC